MWTWRTKEFDYSFQHFNTKEEAIESVRKLAKIHGSSKLKVIIERVEMYPLETFIEADVILDKLSSEFSEQTGYDFDIYENISSSDIEWLEKKIKKLMEEFHDRTNMKSNIFNIVESECIDI